MPNFFPESQSQVNLPAAILDIINKLIKLPKFRRFQEDELEKFAEMNKIQHLNDIDECLVKNLSEDFR